MSLTLGLGSALAVGERQIRGACDNLEGDPTGELDGQGDWSEVAPSTDIFQVNSSPTYSGNRSIFVVGINAAHFIEWDIGTHTSDLRLEYFIRLVDAAGESPRWGFAGGTSSTAGNQGPLFRVNASILEAFDGSSWQSIQTGMANDTWYKLDMTTNLSADTFTISVDDDAKGSFDFRNNLAQIANFFITTTSATGGDHIYFDDLSLLPRSRSRSRRAPSAMPSISRELPNAMGWMSRPSPWPMSFRAETRRKRLARRSRS